jgi:hypothetical protein
VDFRTTFVIPFDRQRLPLTAHVQHYALAVAQRAVGRDSLGQASVASIAGFTPSATDKQFGVRFGVRHKF